MNLSYSPAPDTLYVKRLAGLYLIDVTAKDAAVPLVFDTGGSMTLITRSAAKALHARPGDESLMGSGSAGLTFPMETVLIPEIQLGQTVLSDVRAAVLDDAALDFGEDDDGTPLRFYGLLGIDVIRHFTWHFGALSSSFVVEKPQERQVPSNMEPWDNMPIIRVKVGGREELFGFDSGNTRTILGGRLYPLFSDARVDTDTFAGVDGKKEESVRRAESFTLTIGRQTISLADVPVVNRPVFPARNNQICGLLASDILQGKCWTFDALNRFFEIRESGDAVKEDSPAAAFPRSEAVLH